ncbi:MAG: YDG domain-containing protein [Spirosomaceae bacterium]|nr:YDG domain-containing protein [Spirosomataceae bacterium]
MKKTLHFIRFTLFLVLLFASFFRGFGQTTLSVGDVSIIGFNSNTPDNFAFVTWVNLAPNTVIKFTDNGFLSSNSATSTNNGRGGENFVTWTNSSGATILAGTVIKIENGTGNVGTASIGTVNQTLSGISNGGDQIFAYQGVGTGTSTSNSDFGSNANPTTFTGTILFGLTFPNTWLSSGSATSNTSYLPLELNVPNGNIVITPSATGGQYTGSRTNQTTMSAYRSLVNNSSNWTVSTSTGLTNLNTTAFTLAIPTISTTGTLTAVNTTYGTASATPTSFSVSGINLSDNILITPPAGYEVSQTAGGVSGYADTQTLTQTGGTVGSTTIYVRLKATAMVSGSPYFGNIVLSSSGTTSVNVATVSSSVSPKSLTITGITADNKVYDGSNSATISGTPVYVGLENGETFAVNGSPTATFVNAAVGNSKTVTVTGYTTPSSNYTVSQPSLSANITPAPITISNPIAQNKVYDRTTNAVISGTLNGIIGSEVVILNGAGAFVSSAVGDGISVTSTSTLGGADAGNYILTQPTGLTANITVKLLTITGISANNKVYDGNTNATLSGTPSLNGVVAGDENDVILGGLPIANFTQSTVGTSIAVTVTGYSITGSAATNYALSQPSGLVADITNLPTPVITSSLTASATYGVPTSTYTITATNSPTSFNATGLPAGLSINTTTGEISGTPTSTAGSPFSVTISATNDGGTGSAILIYTINKKTITVNPVLAQNKIYDRTNAATISGTLEGIVGTDEVTLVGTGTFAQSSVGDGISVTSTATLAGADAGKYTLAQPTGLVANITKKALTASATGVNKVYDGTTTAQFLATTNLFGVILPDVVSVSGGGNFVSSEVGDDILINPSLVLGGTDADNYSIIQPTGITANITKASLSISGLTATNKTYDGNTSATLNGTPILEGVINNDDVSIAGTVSAIFNNKNIGTAKPVNVTGYTLNGTKAGNYTLTQPTGLTANISALALSLFGATAQNKVFDGNTNATITGTLTGIISPDVVTFAGVGTFATSAVGNGIAVTANITLGGAGASNYTITQPTGLTANITPTPSLTEVIFPQYIQGVNGTNSNRIPFAYRATLNNLIPNATYRYYNGVELTTASLTSAGAGNNIFVDANQSNNFTYSTAPSLSTAGGYGTFTTDANGSYTGWFIIAPSGNATRFVPGNNLYTRIILNNGTGGTSISTVLSSTNTIKVINLVSTAGANNGTGLRGNSGATDKNFVFAYDNTAGTGRPLSGTFVENDGAAQVTSFASFYTSNVDGISGAYGLVIPNDNANGVRRVEQRDFTTGAIAGCAATDEDGTWASGANTVNPTGGTSAIVLTSGDAPLNTCQVFNIAPTIAIDVATTTNYIDGGVDTNISGSYPISAVIDDPTDPAKTLGVDFTIGDTETAVGSLTVTVTSNNTTVVPNANLILTGAGASRNLKITPIASGYAPITITVNDGTTSTIFTLNYAASQAADITTNTRFHTGKSDASTAIKVDNDLMLVADDEDQTIRLYNRNNSGLPVNSFDFTSVLGLTDISGGVPREVDIEASLKIGNSIYWMGSESNASNGNNRPNRNRVFKTDISGTGIGTSLIYVSRYDFLKDDILAWDANNLHGKGANYYGLVASASAGVIPESTALNGFNIEGIEIAPDNTTAYVAFRAPQVIPSDRKKALIIPITNFTSILAANGGTIGSATFGTPIELNLGERGIREIRKNDTNEYLIIAGPADAATGTAPKDFKFYTWTGKPTDEPIKRSFNLSSLNVDGSFESIVEVPSNLNSITNIQLLVDNGDAIYYGDGTIAKELPQNNWKKFRSEIISLSAPVIEVGSIAQNLCEQSSLSLPFVINNETFNSGNIFTAQLSDANGSFANPVSIGTLSSLNSGTINATIPANTVTGTGYRIRIVSSIPTIVGADNGTNLTINAKPSKPTINASSTTICSGNSVTLTASACNGGI